MPPTWTTLFTFVDLQELTNSTLHITVQSHCLKTLNLTIHPYKSIDSITLLLLRGQSPMLVGAGVFTSLVPFHQRNSPSEPLQTFLNLIMLGRKGTSSSQ